MTIILNGEGHETSARNLAELCESLGLGPAQVATALNSAFVPASARAAAGLQDQDRVEILGPRQGG